MSWYYAGPNAQPVGPISLEELKSRYAEGLLTSDTYIIDQSAGPGLAWKKYHEFFPDLPVTPPPLPKPEGVPILPESPTPPLPASPLPLPLPVTPSPFANTSVSQPHFQPPPPQPPRIPYAVLPTNSNATIGFWFGVASWMFLMTCCLGFASFPLALPGFIFSAIGFLQVRARKETETGLTYALIGLLLNAIILALFACLIGDIAWNGFHDSQFTYNIRNGH